LIATVGALLGYQAPVAPAPEQVELAQRINERFQWAQEAERRQRQCYKVDAIWFEEQAVTPFKVTRLRDATRWEVSMPADVKEP